MNALIISLSPGIGDFIVKIPALRFLSRNFESCGFISALPQKYEDFVKSFFKEDEPIEFFLTSRIYHKSIFYRYFLFFQDFFVLPRLKNKKYDVIIFLGDSNSPGGIVKLLLLSNMVSLRARKFAIKPPRFSFLGCCNIDMPALQHKREKFTEFSQKVLKIFANETKNLKQLQPVDSINPIKENTIVFAPGSKRLNRRWPYFDQLITRISQKFPQYRLFVVGTPDERAFLVKTAQDRATVWHDKDMLEVKSLLSRSKLLVCNDSGLMHLGVNLGINTFALCGPEIFETWCDYKEAYFHAFFRKVHCHPCQKWDCKELLCLRSIPVEEVFNKIAGLLDG